MAKKHQDKPERMVPVENHETAAWRGHIVATKPESNVGIPSDADVLDAKEWVDSNQK